MKRDGSPPDLPAHPIPPPTEWLSTVRAYLNEDWFTSGIADYLEAQANSLRTTRSLACLGCGQRFPRADLWVHHRFDDVAYCDACYYRRFRHRQPA